MSYILDALRRADSESAPGTVPGLHSQPTASETRPPRRTRLRPLAWILGGGAIGLIVTLVVWFAMRPSVSSDAATGVPAVAGASTAGSSATAAGSASSAPAESSPATAGSPGAGTAAGESARIATPDPLAPIAPPAPWRAAKPAAEAAKGAGSAPAASPATRAGQAGAGAAGTAPTAATPAQPPIVLRDDLPANLKAELPPLAVGGSMYSSVPANRTLILDGRLVRENERLTPELVLEEIRMKSAVLRYKGHRFEVRY